MTRTARLALACALAAAVAGAAAPTAGAARRPAGPSFTTYHRPGEHDGAGEPTIGINPRTGAAMYQSGLTTVAVTWDRRGVPTWTDRTTLLEGLVTLDPILETDPRTGRTFVSQLAANCSLLSYTDDDGRTWTPTTGCGPGVYVDHQTVGVGPYADPAPVTRLLPDAYPNAVYYCAQAVAEASCARSDDGGTTFGPAVPMYTIAECSGLHGHMRVAPDGAAYVPHQDCGGRQGVVVSEDNGTTWDVRTVPSSTVNHESDPSVAAGSGGTVYLGWQDGPDTGNTRALVATTTDRGRTWSKPVDVSSRLGLRNVQFPAVVAGDDDRAAIAFLGTKTGGDDQLNSFGGEWRLYVATTYDRGRTWQTVNATPRELVQRGCIDIAGTTCAHRNLLDFNDVAIDRQGRVLVAWADGCPRQCEDRTAEWESTWHGAVITRQTGGRGLYRAYDGRL